MPMINNHFKTLFGRVGVVCCVCIVLIYYAKIGSMYRDWILDKEKSPAHHEDAARALRFTKLPNNITDGFRPTKTVLIHNRNTTCRTWRSICAVTLADFRMMTLILAEEERRRTSLAHSAPGNRIFAVHMFNSMFDELKLRWSIGYHEATFTSNAFPDVVF